MPSALFWTGVPGGTDEYRCHGPGRALADAGWDVEFDDEGIDITTGGRVRGDPDVVVLCRIMGDYVPDAVRRIRRCGRTAVVFDVDDWFGGIPAWNPASLVPADVVATMHQAMREADLVTCSTPELAEAYGHLNRTVVLPNYLDPRVWQPYADVRPRRDWVSVGWAGAFHWRTGDLELLKPWVHVLLERHPEVRFAAVGCPELLEWLGVDGMTTPPPPGSELASERCRNIHPYAHLPAMLTNLDVGLVPLVYNRFNQAKSWAKGLEMGAMGVPAVASPSREYLRFVEPGVNGYLVRRNEWLVPVERALGQLDELRVGARRVADRYWIDDHIHKWVAAWSSIRAAV